MDIKVVVVYLGRLRSLPPLISLLRLVQDIGCTCEFVGLDTPDNRSILSDMSVVGALFPCDKQKVSLRRHPCQWVNAKFNNWRCQRAYLSSVKRAVNDFVGNGTDTIVWTVGNQLFDLLHDLLLGLGRRHINTAYELLEHRRNGALHLIHSDIYREATLVQCEPNRAEIFAGLYGLGRVPFVIPNCPYPHPGKRNLSILDSKLAAIVSKWNDRMVILYQGSVAADRVGLIALLERVCDEFPSAVVAVMPSYSDGNYGALLSKPNFQLLPTVQAPHHLEVTSYATIGIATYRRNSSSGAYSPLNVVYCAPNKVYEYAGFGIPMLCNDMPGVKYIFDKCQNGLCYKDGDFDDAIKKIHVLLDNYDKYKRGALDLFGSVDVKQLVRKVLSFAASSI